MTEAASAGSYGGRFYDELCRLTKSTCGLSYEDVLRVREMDRKQVLLVLSAQYDLDWLLQADSSSPEGFARIVADRGLARVPEGAARELVLTLTSLVVGPNVG